MVPPNSLAGEKKVTHTYEADKNVSKICPFYGFKLMIFATTMNNCKEIKAGFTIYLSLVNKLGKGTCRDIRIRLLQGFKLVFLIDNRRKKFSVYT